MALLYALFKIYTVCILYCITRLEPSMASDKQIQQLRIDRTQAVSPAKPMKIIMLVCLVVLMVAVYFWGNVSASKINQPSNANAEVNKITSNEIANELSQKAEANAQLLALPQQYSEAERVLDASGHIVARRIATVSSRVTGKLEKLNIEEGIKVTQSQILAELDDKQASIAYQLALADLAAQQALLKEMLIMQEHAEQQSVRQTQLAKANLISNQRHDDSQLKARQTKVQVENRLALVELAKQKAALALYKLEQHKIRAPFDGVVISKNAQVGELISAGGASGGSIRTGVGTIVDMTSLEVEVEVGESYINRVFAGQAAMSTLDAYPQWKINSEVVAVIPTADRQKASIKVRIRLHEVDHRVLPDMGVKVSFLSSVSSSNQTTVETTTQS